MHPELIQIPQIGSPELGYLSVIEKSDYLPFPIKRVYWTYFTPNHVKRGGHAHKELEQIIFAVSGIIDMTLIGREFNHTFTLDTPNKGLLIPAGYWRDIRFSHNAVLLCLASKEYDENDYMRDYEDFERWINN